MEKSANKDTYIFFDIESANSFSGRGHICSFGYVLCDSDFTVLENEDLVMNPRAPFDPILFSETSRCRLAYKESYFLSQPDFSFYYEKIRSLLLFPNRTCIGFAVENDIHFLLCACKDFSKEQIFFSAYDVHSIADKINESHNGLQGWVSFYNIDVSSLCAHKSSDDAFMTMLLVKKICQEKKIPLKKLLSEHTYALQSAQKQLERSRVKQYRRYVLKTISELYYKKNPRPVSKKIDGVFKIAFSPERDIDQCYEIARLIYNNGGILVESVRSKKKNEHIPATYVLENKKNPNAEWTKEKCYAGVRFILMKDLFALLEEGEPPFRKQRVDVPEL